MQFNFAGTGTATITYLEFNVYATVSSTFGAAADYTITVYLPMYNSPGSSYSPFGPSYSSFTYAQCTSSFTVGITAVGTVSNFNSLTFANAQKNVRSNV